MSAVTIIIPRATPRAEALAEDIGKLQEAESILAEKLKKVCTSRVSPPSLTQATAGPRRQGDPDQGVAGVDARRACAPRHSRQPRARWVTANG